MEWFRAIRIPHPLPKGAGSPRSGEGTQDFAARALNERPYDMDGDTVDWPDNLIESRILCPKRAEDAFLGGRVSAGWTAATP